MSTCSNCYNGCTEIVSDRCVKYTGIDVPVLGIKTGDSLSFVEQALITFLVSTLDGTGIKIDLGSTVVCTLVNKYLPTCGDLTIVDISKALIQAACDLQAQVNVIVAELAVLNADYTIPVGPSPTFTPCLTGVTSSSDTHAIVQAVINKVCQLGVDIKTLALDLDTNYVRYDELDELIQAYLDTSASGAISNRMVPYSVVPYFGSITFFNASGAGTGDWNRIFLCNGNNGTPDLRGRALTGVINGVPGPTMSPAVDPTVSSANPNYSLFDAVGENQISLIATQIPLHTHPNTVSSTVNENGGHRHNIAMSSSGTNTNLLPSKISNTNTLQTGITELALTGITVDTTIVNAPGPVGGGLPHANIQPVVACYYIMYIP
jgi:microcystin-dependent protein